MMKAITYPYPADQKITVIGYCQKCGKPLWGHPGEKQEYCTLHQKQTQVQTRPKS